MKKIEPFWAEWKDKSKGRKEHKKKVNSRFRVIGESDDGKCWVGHYEESPKAYKHIAKDFLIKIEDNEKAIIIDYADAERRVLPDDSPDGLFSGPNNP